MGNFVNEWIRDGNKKLRRLIVAGACFVGAGLLLLVPWGWVGSIVLAGIGAWKVKNALTDET